MRRRSSADSESRCSMSPTRPASPPPAPKRPPHLRPLDGPGRDALVHVIVFDFRDARVKLTKMQSMWYHLVFRLWPCLRAASPPAVVDPPKGPPGALAPV